MVSLNWYHQQEGHWAALLEEVKAWEEAEVRVWHFSCTHDRFALRLARSEAEGRVFKFLAFVDCGPIAVRNLDRLSDVQITALHGDGWCFTATGISIEFRICSLRDLSAEALQEISGIAPPILLGEKFGDFHIPRMAPLLKGGGHYGYRDEQELE